MVLSNPKLLWFYDFRGGQIGTLGSIAALGGKRDGEVTGPSGGAGDGGITMMPTEVQKLWGSDRGKRGWNWARSISCLSHPKLMCLV